MKKEFISVFQISRTIIFKIEYYTMQTNNAPHFSTSACEFARNKRDFVTAGQAQKVLLKGHRAAMKFYKKWDKFHLCDLSEDQYNELMEDIEKLKGCYNFVIKELDESKRPYSPRFPFIFLAKWSKQKPKTTNKK